MIRSTLLRRTLVLVFSTVLLTALLTLGLYQIISPYVFANVKSEELLPKARLLAEYVAMLAKGELSQRTLIPLIGNNSNQWDANVWLVNINGETLISTRTNATGEQLSGTLPESLQSMVEQVLSGEEVVYTGRLSSFTADTTEKPERKEEGDRPDWQEGSLSIQPIEGEGHEATVTISGDSDMVVVGVPIISEPYLYGAIVMAQPMTEVVGGMRSLTNVLLWSILLAILASLPLAYWVARSLSRPMKQMRDVALSMAGGNFDVKADETIRGETGELAGALNYLSGELSNTIMELSVERNRLRRTLNGLSEGIVAIDANGQITHANPAIYALFDTDPDLTDPSPMDVVPNETVWTLYDEVLTGSGHQVEDLRIDGRVLRLSLSPLEEEGQGGIAGVVGIFRDVTAAERLEQTRRDYVANVSHELRTPLTALRALIEPLHDGLVRDDAARDRAYTVILRETMRLSRLVNDMLELSRLQSGTLSLQKTKFDVTRLLREAVIKYEQTAEDMGQSLRLALPEQPLPLVYGNSDRTEQVLVTLLDNAMKYTPEEGSIVVSAAQAGEELHITVADTGVGIPQEDLPHVFERFYKADKAHQTKGTGLGLAIAREILKQLGERIWVESTPGEGASFTFTLHLAQQRAELSTAPVLPEAAPEEGADT